MRLGQLGTLRPSRAMALALLALAAAAIYFLVIVGLSVILHAQQGAGWAVAVFALPFVCAIAAAIFLPAPRTRGWIKVMLAKHLFAHRYDYRAEWLRFTETLGRTGEPLDTRAARAIADIADAPAALLLLPEGEALVPRPGWNWDGVTAAVTGELPALLASGRIVDLDALRASGESEQARAVPEWMLADPQSWAIVPLIHIDRLAGAVLLARPAVARALDWEDFDLLRVAGRGVAATLAEAASQDALAELKRFDEFNRRFAFIMHDVKNLASQLTLVARNAHRHADNPEFRKDMVATLDAATAKLNDLLARLSQHHGGRPDAPRRMRSGDAVEAVAHLKRAAHPVVVTGDPSLAVLADPARLETALTHLVQNAIDASPPTEPVTISVRTEQSGVAIEVSDQGAGMTADFIRTQLFRAFASTKQGGFGIGAHEARELIASMGGRLEVASTPGCGSRFSVHLPSPADWEIAA